MMQEEEVLRKVREIVADIAEIPVEAVHGGQSIRAHPGMDSLAVTAALVAVHKHFRIKPQRGQDVLEQLDTPEKIATFVMGQIS